MTDKVYFLQEGHFTEDITDRFGVLPNFFLTASAAPGLVEELWKFARSAYVENPLPALFKERLFVHLSRFIVVRYCIVRHAGFLLGVGRPSGDANAYPETVAQVTELITRPTPDVVGLQAAYDRLGTGGSMKQMPRPRTQEEYDLFDALTVMFLDPRRSDAARKAVRAAVGDTNFELLSVFLIYVRTAHYWTKMHPDIAYEPDVMQMMVEHQDLAGLLLDLSDAEGVQAGDALRNALTELANLKSVLNRKESREAFLLKLSDTLRPLNDPRDVQRIASHMLGEHLGVNRAGYGIIEGEDVIVAGTYTNDVFPLEGTFPYRAFGEMLGKDHDNIEAVVINDIATDPYLSDFMRDNLRALDIVAHAGVMYRKDDQWIATFSIQCKAARTWTKDELNLLREVGERIVAEGERIRAEMRLRQSEERHAFLLRLGDALRPLADPLEIQQTAVNMLGTHRDASCVTFSDVFVEERCTVVAVEYRKPGVPSLLGRYEHERFPGILADLSGGQPLIVENMNNVREDDHEFLTSLPFKSMISFPLMRNGQLMATMTVRDAQAHPWSTRDVDFLKETAERTWAMIERARAVASLRENQRQLTELVKQKDDFIGIASHELKTPVTSIKTYAEILMDRFEELGDKDDIKIMGKLDTQLDRLTLLIKDLLDTAKISQGTLPMNFQHICLNQLLSERREELQHIGVKHNLKFALGCTKPVAADKERICQVIINLISNAVKYSPEGSDVEISTADIEGGVKLSVRDFGIGIDATIKNKIFERFFRAQNEIMSTYPGMGLGLYISAGIINRHNGSIAVESAVGQGAEFCFTLPVVQLQ